jgi:hypothetical protein
MQAQPLPECTAVSVPTDMRIGECRRRMPSANSVGECRRRMPGFTSAATGAGKPVERRAAAAQPALHSRQRKARRTKQCARRVGPPRARFCHAMLQCRRPLSRPTARPSVAVPTPSLSWVVTLHSARPVRLCLSCRKTDLGRCDRHGSARALLQRGDGHAALVVAGRRASPSHDPVP